LGQSLCPSLDQHERRATIWRQFARWWVSLRVVWGWRSVGTLRRLQRLFAEM